MCQTSDIRTNKIIIRKKILITIPWFLPAYRAGGPVRSIANLVENIPEMDFYIFTGNTDVGGILSTDITTGKWTQWNNHTQVWYSQPKRRRHELAAQSKAIRPDVIFAIGIYSWLFTWAPLLFTEAPVKIISVRGMLHPGALRQKKWRKKLFFTGLNILGIKRRFIFHATDVEEEQYIHSRLGSEVRTVVAANFPTRLTLQPLPFKRRDSLRLITIALISPMKNIRKVLEQLKDLSAVIEYKIYGAVKDEAYWQQCKDVIDTLPSNVTVDYIGAVRHDEVERALADSHLFILPSKSENFGHAIYEALSAGRPVITSFNTPYRNLRDRCAGINLDPDTVGEITGAIDFFAKMNNDELRIWSENAASYAASFCDSAELHGSYERLFTG